VAGEKLLQVDAHVWVAVAGLRADGRVLVDRARQACQEYRLTYGEAPTVTPSRNAARRTHSQPTPTAPGKGACARPTNRSPPRAARAHDPADKQTQPRY
jgi:hypothetical protein